MAPANDFKSLRWRLAGLCVLLLALLALALAWSATPMRAWLDIDFIVTRLQQLGQTFGPVAAVAGFTVAVALAVPLSFLTLVTIVAFGPWAGYAYSISGALLGAVISYMLGMTLGRVPVQRLGGERVRALNHALARRGLLTVIAVRMVPVAPFAIVNMVAGASHIRLRDLLLGTAIGMTPFTVAAMIFMPQMIAALKQPNATGLLILAATVLLIGVGTWGLRRWIRHIR
jgi:uncharacterized membrane protein YdjX (TVP38/TMEM64 family)